jgi:hypothetical protein
MNDGSFDVDRFIAEARARGWEFRINGKNLLVEMKEEPAPGVLQNLERHVPAIISRLSEEPLEPRERAQSAADQAKEDAATKDGDGIELETTEAERIERFLAIRKEAAALIDPETAEVFGTYGYGHDPYGVDQDLPEELKCLVELDWARAPGSDIWVAFADLPEEVREALWKKHQAKPDVPTDSDHEDVVGGRVMFAVTRTV